MVETDMLSKLFLNRRKRRGSALILSIIIAMLMVILCSSIMMFTLQNFRSSKIYADMNAGYYSSEENLESGLKFLQNFLKDCDNEAMTYVKNKSFMDNNGVLGEDYIPTSIKDKYNPNMTQLKVFYKNVADYWKTKTTGADPAWDPKKEEVFNKEVADFSDEVYIRYYFILVQEIMNKAKIDENVLKDEDNDPYGTLTNESFNDFFTKNAKVLNSPAGSDIQLDLQYGATNNYNDLFVFSNDAVSGNLETLRNIFTDSAGAGIGKEYTNKQTITITYVKNADAKGLKGKAVKEKTINTRLDLIPPDVHFIVSSKIDYIPLIDNFNPIVANAATAMGNIIVNGNNVTINGDVRAGASTTSLVSKDDYANHVFANDVNSGGININANSELNINGNLYSSGYVHTVGQNAKLNVKAYSLSDINVGGLDTLKSFIGMTDIDGHWISSAFTGDPYAKTFDSNGKVVANKPQGFTYISNSTLDTIIPSDNANGGYVFCKRLKTEGTANASSIFIDGGTLVDGSVQADGEHSTITINKGYYGLSSGSGATSLGTNHISNGDHSCIVQNALSATIAIGGEIYVPSRAYSVLSGVEGSTATSDYYSAESISLPKGSTLDGYANETSFLTDASLLPPGASMPTATLNSTAYKPFSLYDFGETGQDVKNQWKSFISYFKDKGTYPSSNVSLAAAKGFMQGIGVTTDGVIITKSLLNGEKGEARSATWYDPAKIKELDDLSPEINPLISNLRGNQNEIRDQIFNTKVSALYSNRLRFTARYFDKDNNLHDENQTGALHETSPLDKVDTNVIIKNGNVDLSASEYSSCEFKNETVNGKVIKVFQGVIVAKSVKIPDGYGVKGMVVSQGDITLDGNNVITYLGPEVDTNPTQTDPELKLKLTNKVKMGGDTNYLYQNPTLAEALGLNVKIEKNSKIDAFDFKSAYHVDNMSRFKRTEWKEEDN